MSARKHIHTIMSQFFVALLFVGLLTQTAAAQEASSSLPATVDYSIYTAETLDDDRVFGDFVVGPGKLEVEIAPGETKTVELMVTNRMGELKRFELTIEDTVGSDDPTKAVVLLGEDRGPYSVQDIISYEASVFELEHAQRGRIPVTISLPADAEPGGYYGSILVSTISREADLTSDGLTAPKSAIISRIGTLLFITTPGEEGRSGSLQDFSTVSQSRYYSSGPITFGMLYENTGTVHVNPYGELRIYNMLGDEVGYEQIEPWFALPQSSRLREITWNRDWLFGKYTAIANINRGYDDIVDTRETTFWVIDWPVIITAFAVLFIFFYSIRFLSTRFELKRKD